MNANEINEVIIKLFPSDNTPYFNKNDFHSSIRTALLLTAIINNGAL